MKEYMKKKRLFFAVLLILSICMTVVIEASERKGSIELQFAKDGAGIEMSAFKVADYDDGDIFLRQEFIDSGIQITDIGNASELQKASELLQKYVEEKKIKPLSVQRTTENRILFSDLEFGMYFIVQTDGMENLLAEPVLVVLPSLSVETGTSVTDIVLAPKTTFPGGAVIVDKVNGDNKPLENAQFLLQQKIMADEAEELPEGVQIEEDEDGNTFYWKTFQGKLVSNKNGQFSVSDLPMGSYRILETQAPEGYVLNSSYYEFEITAAGKVEDPQNGTYEVVSGEAEEFTVINVSATPITSDEKVTLLVNKKLVDLEFREIAAKQDYYLVALFSSPERTPETRVSDIKKILFSDQSESGVMFENLSANTTYYVGEVDENGNLIESGWRGEAGYQPYYGKNGEDYSVILTEDGEYSFFNRFVKLSEEYYYVGKILITKQLLKNGQPDTNSTECFYAMLYLDGDLTQPALDDVIELQMEKGFAFITIELKDLYIGDHVGNSMDYYLAETDENGENPVINGTYLKYHAQIDNNMVSITSDSNKNPPELVIKNDFTEADPTVIPTETPILTSVPTTVPGITSAPDVTTNPTSSPSGGLSSSGKGTISSTTNTGKTGTQAGDVETGDQTPIMGLLLLLLAAAVVVGGIVLMLIKRKR